MFETAAPGRSLGPTHGEASGVSLTVLLDAAVDIDALHAALQAAGVTICAAIGDRPWGNRDFGLRDPDGYHVTVAKPLTSGS